MAVRSLGQLTLDLVARTSSFTGPLGKAERATQSHMKKIQAYVKKAGVSLTALGAAGAAGAGVLAAAAASASSDMRNLVRDAEAVGATAEDLSTWQYAARDMGVEADKVGDIFKDVQDKVNDFVRTGGGEAADIFEQLGLNARDFIGLAPDQAILRISEAMDGLTQGEKIFFMESIADDASRLIPLLDNGAERFNRLAEEGRNFGTIVTNEQAEVAQGFDRMLERATHMVEGFQTQLGAELSPTFEGVLNWLEEITDGFGGPREAAQALAVAIVTAMRDSVKGVQTLTSGLEDAYDIYLAIRELEAKSRAIGGTINNILEGDDTLPDGFMDLQQIQAERARLANGEGFGSDAVASLDRLIEHMDAANNRSLPELSDSAVNAASNIGILANSALEGVRAMNTARDSASTTQPAPPGVIPTAAQAIAPARIAAPAAGLRLSSITPMSADQYNASVSTAIASSGNTGAPGNANMVNVNLTVMGADGNASSAEGMVEKTVVDLLVGASSSV